MRKYILLVLLLLPLALKAAELQSIVFTGTYSLNNVATDADSAWLHIAYYDTYVGSTLVAAEDPGWGGYYRHAHMCTNDSSYGWSGIWVFVDNSHGVRGNCPATVSSARDSVDVTTGVYVYQVLTNGIKASSIEADAIGASEIATGAIDDDAIADGAIDVGGELDTTGLSAGILVMMDSLKDTTEAMSARLQTEAEDAIDAKFIFDNDSVITDQSSMVAVGDTNTNPFNNTTDSTLVDVSAAVSTFLVELSDTVRVRLDSLFAFAIEVDDSLGSQEWATAGVADVDTEEIARAVWDNDVITQDLRSVTANCGGSGSYSCTLWVRDTANAAYVQGAKITVNNQTEDGSAVAQNSNENGYKVFQLDAGDYRASVTSPPGIFDAVDFTVPSGSYNDSILGYYPTIGTPSAASVCSVYCWIQDVRGQKIAGARVSAALVASVDTTIDGNMLTVDHRAISNYSDADGYWSLGLIKNSVVDTTSHYRITIYGEGISRQEADVYVPDSSTVNFNDLLRNYRRK